MTLVTQFGRCSSGFVNPLGAGPRSPRKCQADTYNILKCCSAASSLSCSRVHPRRCRSRWGAANQTWTRKLVPHRMTPRRRAIPRSNAARPLAVAKLRRRQHLANAVPRKRLRKANPPGPAAATFAFVASGRCARRPCLSGSSFNRTYCQLPWIRLRRMRRTASPPSLIGHGTSPDVGARLTTSARPCWPSG